MSKGIVNVNYIRQGSQVTVGDQPNWGFLYQHSTVRDERFNIGDRQVTPDGRAFRFSKVLPVAVNANSLVRSGFGAGIYPRVNISDLAPVQVAPPNTILGVVASAGAVGDSVLTVNTKATSGVAADGVIAADELRGGYIVIGNETFNPQNRGIIGNTAGVAGAITAITVFLDAPLTTAVTAATTYIEIMPNPYKDLYGNPGSAVGIGFMTFAGVPAVTAAASEYFWLQTWGPCWITPSGTPGAAHQPGYVTGDREVFFVGDGSIYGGEAATVESGWQRAGTIMQRDAAASAGPPFVFLQINP
jgi:hypothetical protein